MRKIFGNMTFFVYKQFKLFWIFFTIFLLIILSYINWNNNVKNSLTSVTEVSHKLTYNIDRFINDILQNLYLIPSYQKENLTCENNFLPFLQYMAINHAQISGLAIRDKKHQIICSTLPHNQTFLLSQNVHQTTIGPLKIPMFHHPIFAIQKKIGDYQVEIILMTSILENMLNTPESSQHIITLYDVNQKKKLSA